MHGRDG
jgi:hypothetical protein